MKALLTVLLALLCAKAFSQNIEFEDEIIGFGHNYQYPIETTFYNNTDQTVSIDSVKIDSITDLTRYIHPDIVPYEGEISLVDIDLGVAFYGTGDFGKYAGDENIEITAITIEPNSTVRVVVSDCYNDADWNSDGFNNSRVFFILNLSLYTSTGDVAGLKIGGVYVGEYSSIDFSPFDFEKQGGNLGESYKEILLYSANGRLVKTESNSRMQNIDTRNFPPGIYFARVKGLDVFRKITVSSN